MEMKKQLEKRMNEIKKSLANDTYVNTQLLLKD